MFTDCFKILIFWHCILMLGHKFESKIIEKKNVQKNLMFIHNRNVISSSLPAPHRTAEIVTAFKQKNNKVSVD